MINKVRISLRTVPVAIPLVFSVVMLASVHMFAQPGQGRVSGVISDPTGALIPNAEVTLAVSEAVIASALSDAGGVYSIQLPPGEYVIDISAPGFDNSNPAIVKILAGRTLTHNVRLAIAVVQEQVQVSDVATLDTEPTSNASAITLKDSSLDSLSDDAEELAQDLTALAGPGAGPDGGELYVDGFSGGKLPPKSSIREIRVNQNPFSAEYDRIGFGRVEILTKPGTAEFHGDARFNFGDSIFYARNPFAIEKPDFQRRIFEGILSGPLKKGASFTVQIEQRNIGQTAVINALMLDTNLNPVVYRDSILNPTTNTEVSVRLDYELNQNHTLTGRYEWEKDTEANAGLDSFSLPSTAYNSDEREHLVQFSETAILNPRAVNEVRFQYRRSHDVLLGSNNEATIEVPEAFVGGGSVMGLSGLTENRYEFHNVLSLIRGPHNLKTGGRLRVINEANRSMENYNGTFTFTSLEAYQITEAGLRNGLPPSQIRALGGGASQFALASGNPVAELTQVDAGLFVQDDWRIHNNLTLSAGLRFEKQNNINDWRSWAPRIGIAWAPRISDQQQPLAVIRAGFGLFYDRIRESLVLDTKRLNGVSQQASLIPNPDFYPHLPAASELTAFKQDQVLRVLGDDLRAPFMQQLALSIERQFVNKLTVSASYTNSRGVDSLRSRNVNAFLEGTFDPLIPDSGVRPFPGGNIYAYESAGRFRQDQVIANMNSRINNRSTLFGYYTWSSAKSDTDGAKTFPGNPYNLVEEYGRAGFDVHHRAFLGGTLTGPRGFAFSPFIVIHTGEPFDITTGEDLNGDSVFNDRPAWATDLNRSSVVRTRWGIFDTRPQSGQVIVPRNFGDSPGMFGVNLRVSKSFGFGEKRQSGATQATSGPGMAGGHGPGGGHAGHHNAEGSSTDRTYSLTFSVAARNLFNRVNLDTPVGNLSSPVFGESTSIHGFGHGTPSANRTIDFQVRFSF